MDTVFLNPYVTGGALTDPSGQSFYGREDIFEFVHAVLASRQCLPILLYGHRRIGKSSVLRQLPHHLPPELVCVYFDLQGKGSMDLNQVLYGLSRAIADEIGIAPVARGDYRRIVHRQVFTGYGGSSPGQSARKASPSLR